MFHFPSLPGSSTLFRRARSAALLLAASLLAAPSGPAPAGAFGESRTLTFVHTHRDDSITVTFRRNGAYDQAALSQLNWFLRDWRSDEATTMDPRLFDILWEMQQQLGSAQPIHVISAYRSPATNGALRRRSGGVADNSLHMAGKAIDIRIPGLGTAGVRATAMQLQHGGVGYYPGSDFVHVDTGSVRAWPRMSKEQLIALFPTGKTLHLPANGTPLAGYEQARLEVTARQAALASAGSVMPARGLSAPSVSAADRAGRSRPEAQVQVASAGLMVGTTGALVAKIRDEQALLKALFVSPAGAVSPASTPLMHMAASDQPPPFVDSLTRRPMLLVRFESGRNGGEDTGRFKGPAVEPLLDLAAR